MNCPVCGGECWDNRETKKNPKAPDYKCKDKSCEGVIWPPKGAKPAPSASQGPSRAPKWTWNALAKTYERSLLLAELRLVDSAERLKLTLTMEDVIAATATIFIAASRDGVEEPAKKLPPKKPVRQDAEPEQRGPGPEEFDDPDTVPF